MSPKKRTFITRNPKVTFLCPLCGVQRGFRYSSKLSAIHYLQIVITSVFLGWITFPLFGVKSFGLFFLVWLVYEWVYKMNFRKEIPCPECGFDSTWYKRDVRVARKIVEDFWKDHPLSQQESELPPPEREPADSPSQVSP